VGSVWWLDRPQYLLRKYSREKEVVFLRTVPALFLALHAMSSEAFGQIDMNEPTALIDFLANRTETPNAAAIRAGLFGCGQESASLAAAQRLAGLGKKSIPSLERELSAMERRGNQSMFGSFWLQLVYARLKGRLAFDRIERMARSADPASIDRASIDEVLSLALNVTSYVSSSRKPMRRFHCLRAPEPRDALDNLISAWHTRDRIALQENLSPRPETTLRAIFGSSAWSTRHKGERAIGYRFRVSGRWGEPSETLLPDRDFGDARELMQLDAFSIETSFSNQFGVGCRALRVGFVRVSSQMGETPMPYLVDSSKIREILEALSACASSTAGSR